MNVTLYGIPNCDTVKKARAWLDGQGVAVRFHDFRKDGVPVPLLDAWIGDLGWERLVNRKGTTWRRLPPERQAAVADAAAARELMLAEPSAIRRPVVDWGTSRTVGFDTAEWQKLLGC
jgi:Spx/MgsR family transcriptional regulator